ncbi:MAG: hypothetical protein WA971_01345 [Microbacterium sp.]
MTRRAPLPPDLRRAPFSVQEARSRGVTESRLRAHDLAKPTRGVRAIIEAPEPVTEGETAGQRMERLRRELVTRATQIAPALTPDQFFSHSTGLALTGVPLPFTRASAHRVHLSSRRPAGQPRRSGTIGHRLQEREPARWKAKGLPIEHPARMWRQAAAEWRLDDLIIAADHLILPRRRLLTAADLRREVEEAGEAAGRLLSRALAEARTGAESPEETRLRLLLVRSGLPEPEVNLDVFDGGSFVGRLDLAFPRYRVGVEYDGRVHAENDRQFARDADRWDAIRAAGWQHVRILSHHLRPNPQVALDKTTRALFNAGWRPAQD